MTERTPKNVWQKGRKNPDSRQRPAQLNLRLTPDEAKRVREVAEANGVSIAALIRQAVLSIPLPKRQRRPRADEQAIARLLDELAAIKAELGKSGSNLNQIAHYLNADRSVGSVTGLLEAAQTDHEEAMRTLLELRTAALQALGLERGNAD